MKLKMFAVFDEKAGAHMVPFFMMNEALGMRAFMNACTDSNNQVGKNPEDYTFWLCGEFDDVAGEFKPERKLVCTGAQVGRKQ